MNAAIDEDFSGMHEPHWVLRSAFQLLVLGLVFTEVMLALTVHRGLIWLAVPLVLVASHLMHGALIGLHEAAHGLLRKNRGFNEFDGVVIGTLSLMSFSLYRVVHQTHHAYLATERDYEFWPLSQTTMPRWKRCLAAFFELNFGLFYSPFVFLRAFLLFSFSGPKQTRSPAHLGGIGADNCDVDFDPLGNRGIRPLEIFHLDVSRTGCFGG